MNSPHRIEARQNEPQLRSWLLAQKLLYSRVKRLMGLQLTLVVVGIALALFGGLGTWRPDLAQAAAAVPLWVGPLFGLAVALLNTFWIPTRQQRWRSDAAHVQELFDTELLQMPWPQAGTTISDDEMRRAQVFDAAQPSRALKDDDPTNWYDPSAVAVALRRKKPESEGWLRPDSGRHTLDDLPLALARLVCQSQNLQWDLRQRDRYGDWLRALFWGLWLLALLPALVENMPVQVWLLKVLSPIVPGLLLLHQMASEQKRVVDRLKSMQERWAKIWEEALADPQRSDLDAQARELQDRIFQHRRTAPPFFDWLYELWRQGNQAHTQQVACDRVDEAVAALKSLAARPTSH
jgi:hypothetical protein